MHRRRGRSTLQTMHASDLYLFGVTYFNGVLIAPSVRIFERSYRVEFRNVISELHATASRQKTRLTSILTVEH